MWVLLWWWWWRRSAELLVAALVRRVVERAVGERCGNETEWGTSKR